MARLWDAASGSLAGGAERRDADRQRGVQRLGRADRDQGRPRRAALDAAGRPLPGTAAMRLEGDSTTPLWFVATAFTPSGNHVATVASDGSRTLWDATNGTRTASSARADAIVPIARFSPDGPSSPRAPAATISIWQVESDVGSRWPRMTHDDIVNGIEFSPDGTFLLTASRDRSARLWKVTTGAQVGLLRHYQEVIARGVQRQRVRGRQHDRQWLRAAVGRARRVRHRRGHHAADVAAECPVHADRGRTEPWTRLHRRRRRRGTRWSARTRCVDWPSAPPPRRNHRHRSLPRRCELRLSRRSRRGPGIARADLGRPGGETGSMPRMPAGSAAAGGRRSSE